ncbi:MAG: hypothetical protein LW717_06220 [Chloroflexaceae bacterium]|nr:hypothetical protein [Chloroflexaceae bacterium]
MHDDEKLGMTTRSVHAGWQPDPATGAVKRPLVMANSYVGGWQLGCGAIWVRA